MGISRLKPRSETSSIFDSSSAAPQSNKSSSSPKPSQSSSKLNTEVNKGVEQES